MEVKPLVNDVVLIFMVISWVIFTNNSKHLYIVLGQVPKLRKVNQLYSQPMTVVAFQHYRIEGENFSFIIYLNLLFF